MRRRDELHHQPGNPLEEPGKMQAGNDQHHGGEQNDSCVINAADALGRTDHPKCKHQRCSDDRRCGAVDLRSGKTPNREDQVTGEEYCVSEQKVSFRTYGEGNDHTANSRAAAAEGIEISRIPRLLRLITPGTRWRTNVAMRMTEFVMSEVGNSISLRHPSFEIKCLFRPWFWQVTCYNWKWLYE
jgi:hypothetical protein